MASVECYAMAIDPLDTSITPTTIPLSPEYTVTPQTPGELRQYGSDDPTAPGRVRFVTSGIKTMQTTVVLQCRDRTDVAFLEAIQGYPGACFRDPYGRKFYGVFVDLSVPELNSPTVPASLKVTFTVNEISNAETS